MPEALIQCKSVCKSWKSLISTSRFVESHLNDNHNKKADNNEIGDTRVTILSDNDRLVGSSNGLVCISRFNRKFFVVNPSTCEVKELRCPPKQIRPRIVVSGFGYDSSIDDFKVVIGFYYKCSDNCVFKVLTLKSNIWRSVVAGEVGSTWSEREQYRIGGTLCNGAIHWLFCDQISLKNVIVSFDLSKEVIKEIPNPDQCDMFIDDEYGLGTIKDCLCIIPFRDIHLKKTEEVEIWVMKNYNVQESWERWLPPTGYDTQKLILMHTPGKYYGHFHIWMLEEGSGDAVLVHCLEPRGENVDISISTISECNYNFYLPVYMKSLVSPHGMVDDDDSSSYAKSCCSTCGWPNDDSWYEDKAPCEEDLEWNITPNKYHRMEKILHDRKAKKKEKARGKK